MSVYRSKYSSESISKFLNNSFITKLVKTKDVGYTGIKNVISENNLNGDELNIYNVGAVEELYLHRYRASQQQYELVTHYPTPYATPYDAMYDYNDQISHNYNGRKIVYTDPSADIITFRYVAVGGSFTQNSILKSSTFDSYEIIKIGG